MKLIGMRQLDKRYKQFLKRFAEAVTKDLNQSISDPRVQIIQSNNIVLSNTYGWFIDILRFVQIEGRGRVSLWVDKYANINRPCISLTFWSSDYKRLHKLTSHFGNNFIHNVSEKVKTYNNGEVRAVPLTQNQFHKYIIEHSEVFYLTMYFDQKVIISKLPYSLVENVKEKALQLANIIPMVLGMPLIHKAYPNCKNRKLVRLHYYRERSSTLATKAKLRDSYRCQICGMNFFEVYGALARGYAEAHHVKALKNLSQTTFTNIKDLITVCANCHRVLHLMKGNKNDIKSLRKFVTTSKG